MPHILNDTDEEQMGVPPQTIEHYDRDHSLLAVHEWQTWAIQACDWCRLIGIRDKSDVGGSKE